MKKSGLFFKKIGMIGIWDENNNRIPVTALKLINTTLIDKTDDKFRVFIEFGGHTAKPQRGIVKSIEHLNRDNLKGSIKTIDNCSNSMESGEIFTFGHLNCDYVDVQGISKGKGFQGPMKRWNFSGGRASHGNSLSHRSHGGTGCGRSGPQRVFPGKKMAGHMGNETCTQLHLKVVQYLNDECILLVKGSVPGPKNSMIFVRKSIKGGK
jgi:large subunit ribosomal protein L3